MVTLKKIQNEIKILSDDEQLELVEIIIHHLNRKKELKVDTKKFNPSDYIGIYRDLDIDVEREVIKMRDEWDRDF